MLLLPSLSLFIFLASSSFAATPDSITSEIFASKKLVVKNIDVDPTQQAWLDEAGIRLKRFIGKTANQAMMDGILQKFITYNENNGYPFARAQFDSIQMDSAYFSAKLMLAKGNRMTIDTLIIIGDGRVRPRFLQNHLSLRKPRPYSEEYVQSVDKRINELVFLRTVQPSALEFRANTASLYTYADDGKANRANGMLAFGTDENGEFQLQGEANIFIANMFKGGEELALDWSSPDKNVQLLNLGIKLPYIILGTIGIAALFDMERRDSLYLNLHGRVGLTSRVGNYSTASLFVDLQRHNNTTASTQNSTVSGTLYGVDYTLRKPDNPLFPRSGYVAYLSLAAGTRKVETAVTSTGTSLESAADIAWHTPCSKHISLMLRAQGKMKNIFGNKDSETLYQSELYSIGGANSIRGFNERSIFTSAYAIATIEPRFFYSAQGYFSAFCDYAPVKNESTTGEKYSQFLSLGLGTRFATGVGIFSLSYALGKANGESFLFKNAKVHVGYMVVF